jgi:hypothetical protein
VLGHAQHRRDLAQLLGAPAELLDARRAGDRLDAAHVGRARRLVGEVEEPDLGGGGHMRAAAELARHVLDVDHPDDVAVLLAEERHRAEALGLVARGLDGAHAPAGDDPVVDLLFDPRRLVRREALAVGEVEAQLVGAHVGAGLADVRAELGAQRGVQEVRGGVVGHRGEARLAVHHRARLLAGLDLAALRLDHDELVVAHAHDHVDVGAAGAGLDEAGVGHLTAALGVERALGQLHEGAAVVVLSSDYGRLGLELLVADEARGIGHRARELDPALMLGAAGPAHARARDLAGALHELLEALVVDRQAFLCEQLLRELVGEAEGVVKLEGILG